MKDSPMTAVVAGETCGLNSTDICFGIYYTRIWRRGSESFSIFLFVVFWVWRKTDTSNSENEENPDKKIWS